MERPSINELGDFDVSQDWVDVQQRTFTKWCNNHLSKKSYKLIENAQMDFDDGIMLMHLLYTLYPDKVKLPNKYNKKPKLRPQKLDNITLALKMLDDANIKTNFLGGDNLVDHDRKMILGMLWSIILDYAINGISVDEFSAKEGLLLWCRKKTKGYAGVDPPSIQNFHKDWKNGLALLALIHKHRPDLLNYDDFDESDPKKNIETAFETAESIGISRLLDVNDLMVDRPDEHSVMTYVSQYFHKFAVEDQKKKAANRIQNFSEFHKNIEQNYNDFLARSKELLEWVVDQMEKFVLFTKAENLDQAVIDFNNFRNYIVKEKPPKMGEKFDIEALYAEIETQLALKGRQPLICPEEYHPDSIDKAFIDLSNAENKHSEAVRNARFGLVKEKTSGIDESEAAEYEESFNHFDTDKNGFLDKNEFKAALSAVGIPLRDDQALDKLFNEVSGDNNNVTKDAYVAYLTHLNEDKDSPEQIKASFRAMANDNEFITKEQLVAADIPNDQIEYLLSNMPEKDDGYDYNAYVDSVFKKE